MSSAFPLMNNRTVSIHVSINGTQRVLRGQAKLKDDEDLGRVLSVEVPDDAGSFELLIEEAKWSGQIVRDLTGATDFRICLDAHSACVG
jgi:hypothetical protein